MINEEKRNKIFASTQYICGVCGKHINRYSTPQLAHRIKSGKGSETYLMNFIWMNYNKDRGRKWVNDFILDNEMNLVPVCSLICNDACNIFFKNIERDTLIKKIIEETECLLYEKMY